MNRREYGFIFLIVLIGTTLPLTAFYLLLPRPSAWETKSPEPELHSRVIRWEPTQIPANGRLDGFVGEWIVPRNISVQRIQVWMGNPVNITWEGDTLVVKNRSDFNAPDSLLVHYQFDKHAESPVPHQLMFELSPGFPVRAGETLHVWRLFVNTSPKNTLSGDGEVIIYYILS